MRRRSIITRALITSNISDKYNLILNKRLALLNKQLVCRDENTKFQKEEQKLKLVLFNLEIQYKKALLKSNFGLDYTKIL